MAKTELTNTQKKEWAQLLFVRGGLTQKEIAEKVGTSANTITAWIQKNNWESLKKSLLTTKEDQLRHLYDLLERLSRKLREEDSCGDSKTADMYAKYTAAIRNLETETSIAQITDVAIIFHKFLQEIDPLYAAGVLNHFDAFIKERLKRF